MALGQVVQGQQTVGALALGCGNGHQDPVPTLSALSDNQTWHWKLIILVDLL